MTPPRTSPPTSRRDGQQRPDFVVWPENSTAVDPFNDLDDPRRHRHGLRRRRRADPGGRHRRRPTSHARSSTRASCDARASAAATATPSGTRCPSASTSRCRDTVFTRALRPAAPRARATWSRGTEPRAAAASAALQVADAICFDVAYDDGIGDQVARGAPSCSSCRRATRCSSTPTRSTSSSRSAGCGRSRPDAAVVVAAINGLSGVIAPDGTVVARRRPAHPGGARARASPLGTAVTPGMRLGSGSGAAPSRSPWLPCCWRWSRIVEVGESPPRPRRGRPARPVRADSIAGGRTTWPSKASGVCVMVIPTYNEAEQPRPGSSSGCAPRSPEVDVLVVDDNSPDGTGDIADELAAARRARSRSCTAPRRRAWARPTCTASRVALERGYDVDRRDGRRRLAPARAAAPAPRRAARRRPRDRLSLGARRLGGQLAAVRASSSRAAATSTSGCCSACAVRDATAGFRLFRRATLEAIDLDSVQSTGYVFQTDLAYRVVRAGLRVVEVPIEFIERERGDSKMSGAVATESLKRITRWGLRERRAQAARAPATAHPRPADDAGAGSPGGCWSPPSSWCRWSRSRRSSSVGQADRAVVDHPAARPRQHDRRLADQARGLSRLASR